MKFDGNLGIIGLGYVVPRHRIWEKLKTVGYDNKSRINELKRFKDRTLETTSKQIKNRLN